MNARYLKLLVASLAVVSVGLAYAAIQFRVNHTGTVVLANKNFLGITLSPPSSQPNCDTETSYGNGGDTGALSSISWGNIAQGSSQTAYICIMNADGEGQTYTVTTSSLSPSTGIMVGYNGTAVLTSRPLPSGGTSLIIVNVSISLSTPEGPFSFTTTIG